MQRRAARSDEGCGNTRRVLATNVGVRLRVEGEMSRWERVALAIGMAFLLVVMARKIDRTRERDRAKRTAADMRGVGLALGAYAKDHGGYPRVTSADALAPLLSPTYHRGAVTHDAWGRTLLYRHRSRANGCAVPEIGGYVLASAGRDGVFQPAARRVLDDCTRAFRRKRDPSGDIVFVSGGFVVDPLSHAND